MLIRRGHTFAALTPPPSIDNDVDDDPTPVSVWLPAFGQAVGAPPPPRSPMVEARATAGEDAVSYATKLGGASNAKAKTAFEYAPRRLEWLNA